MLERPLVFISHAGSDKPRIGHIVERLLGAGFRLFVDHPEAIDARYTPEYCSANGVETLWTTAEKDWSDRLMQAIRDCDCVLAIVSDAITENAMVEEERTRLSTYRMEWKVEMGQAAVLDKLVFAKIGSFDSSRLPASIRAQDAPNVASGLSEKALATGFDILVNKRIRPTIEAARRRGQKDSDHFRSIKYLLPLCVGRSRQRRAILQSAEDVRSNGLIRPVVIVGPRNELPHRFLEALPFHDDGQQSAQPLVIEMVDWPDVAPDEFTSEFAANLADILCRNSCARLDAVAKMIAQTGHVVVVHSRYAIETRSVSESALDEWLSFWEQFGETFKGVHVVPALSLFLRPARPGWSDCPPSEIEDAQERRRNLEAWTWLGTARQPGSGEQERFRLPPITSPILRDHAQRWSEVIRDDLIGAGGRKRLWDHIEAVLYAEEAARLSGVNHEKFYDEVVAWFEAA